MKFPYFRDKVVIVTGARQGIGRSISELLATEGAKLVLVSRNADGLNEAHHALEEKGCEVLSIPCDISDEKASRAIIDRTISTFVKIDVLINNAGISGQGNVGESNSVVFRKQIEVNLLGSYYVSNYALPHIKKSEGSILFVSSLAAIYGIPSYSGYSASKMALTALAQSMKIELHGQNVHVGVTHVGFTENDPKKEVYNSKGEIEYLKRRSVKTVTPGKTAELILKQIADRKFVSVHSSIGKIQLIGAKFTPGLIEYILRKNANK
jgi:short-subunit dehydrogenase